MPKTTFAIRRCVGKEYSAQITGLSARGLGTFWIQEKNNAPPIKIEVDGALPGDHVTVIVRKPCADHAEATIEKITHHLPRIKTRCHHAALERPTADRCGGCALQQVDYATQCQLKRNRVTQSFEKQGLQDVEIAPTIAAEHGWFFRNKMELSFGPCHDQVGLGLHPRGYKHEVVALSQCYLLDEGFAPFSQHILKWCQERGLKHFVFRRNNGWLRLLTIRKNTAGQRMLILTTSNETSVETTDGYQPAETLAQQFARDIVTLAEEKNYTLNSVYWTRIDAKKNHKTKTFDTLLYGERVLVETLNIAGHVLRFEILPRAFFQPNVKQAERLYALAIERANPIKTGKILDLYCGTGTIALAFASAGFEVIGIDIEAQSIENARENATRNNLQATFIAGDAGKVLASMELDDIAITIVDPPRRGLLPTAREQILKIGSPYILYISCQPGSLASDLAFFRNQGYEIGCVQPIDMLPQSAHIENIVLITKK